MVFRTPLAESIFHNKYRHEGAENWHELCQTLVEDVCRDRMSPGDKSQLTAYMQDMKCIAGGRYLYYAGRPIKAFNNCATGDTLLLTDQGMKRFDSFADGEAINVYSPISQKFEAATMNHHGEQPVYKYTLAAKTDRRLNKTWTVKFTMDHKWPTLNRGDVENLTIGDEIGAASIILPTSTRGFIHGLMFAAGVSTAANENDELTNMGLVLKGQLAGTLGQFLSEGFTSGKPAWAGGDTVVYTPNNVDMTSLPDDSMGPSYIASFIKGWHRIAATQISTTVDQISHHSPDQLQWFTDRSHLAGIITISDVLTHTNPLQHRILIQDVANFEGFKVIKKTKVGTVPVYCPFEPLHNRIVIDHGVDTFNCYLLRSEEDTREDWAMLSWKAESCLASGGGIGNDYSIYRPKNTPLKRTGGVASGPVSKMRMINEIGREVMQGGSRRSAIYASLSDQHPDVHDLLVAKDWQHIMVPGTNVSIAYAKQHDFNFPAPLDMTNVSVNYGNEWLENYWQTGQVGDVFLKNVHQALMTGEPGFSFNFFEKANETLRNACTEVTSEDDSDVCNLGSVNMSRIETIEEFEDVVRLMSQFLLCGTLVADLPYSKVYDVREKNRRLGLGLMGVHEWLIQRSYRYEVTDELHDWLSVYQDASEDAANELADHLGINRPVAYRAIAPTGTIGILAGTTTGIEPLFSVAYMRRYLTNGTSWKYQYVIDGAAQVLIDLYGADPMSIESALDLAKDPERRIKFQADVQDYVDMSISSTINLPEWGSELNNEDKVKEFAGILAKYAHRLRGFTCYPNGARGGQPLTPVPYWEAKDQTGVEFTEHDICDISGKGGTCGV